MNDDTFTHQVRQRLGERLGTGVRIVSLCPESVVIHFTSKHRDVVSRLPLLTDADGRIDFDASRAESISAAELLAMADDGNIGWPNPVNTAAGTLKVSSWESWVEKAMAPGDGDASAKYFLPIYAELEAVLYENGWRRNDTSLRAKALEIAQERRPDLPRLGTDAAQIAVHTFADDEFSIERMQGPLGNEKTRMDMADSENEYRIMQRIAERHGYQLPRDWYSVRMRFFEQHPERRPRLATAESLEDAATAIALDAGMRLDLMTPDEHVECCQRAAKARADLLKREYGIDKPDDENAAPFELTEEDKRSWRDAEKLLDMARQRIRARGGDVTNRREMDAAVAELVRENPSLIAEKYGMKR